MRSLRQVLAILTIAVLTINVVGFRLPVALAAHHQDAQVKSAGCVCDTTDCTKETSNCASAICMNICASVALTPSFEPPILAYERDTLLPVRLDDIYPAADRPPPLPPPIV